MTRVFCNGKLFLRKKTPPLFLCVCVFSPFFSRPNVSLYVFRVLEVFRSFLWFLHELSLDKQKKNSLSRRFYNTHSQISLSLRFQNHFYARSCSLAAQRESLLPKKKEEHQKHPAKLCCFDSFFGEGARAFRKRKRERERDGELFFFCDEREISVQPQVVKKRNLLFSSVQRRRLFRSHRSLSLSLSLSHERQTSRT